MPHPITWLIVALCLIVYVSASAGIPAESATDTVRIDSPISSPYYPVTVPGKMLPMLRGLPTARITLFAIHSSVAVLIPFQIDQRESNGQYRIDPALDDERPDREFTTADELVFMAADIGTTASAAATTWHLRTIAALTVGDGEARGTVYIAVTDDGPAPRSAIDYVHYDASNDSISTTTYRIHFHADQPFLVSGLQWRRSDGYGPNLIDTMKIRHRGKLFGKFDFLRTQADYRSTLTAVKDGPIRIIRRTTNRVRVLWALRSPGVDIDYIAYANHIVMDTTLDFPFRIGWFFKDVTTFASMDLAGTPGMHVYNADGSDWLNMDGRMSAAKQHYNESRHKNFIMSDQDGMIVGTMHLTDRLPIVWHVLLVDDVTQPDPPESITGQFGNIGFFTSRWEMMDTDVHHLYYSFYLIPPAPVEQARELLAGAPHYGQDRR